MAEPIRPVPQLQADKDERCLGQGMALAGRHQAIERPPHVPRGARKVADAPLKDALKRRLANSPRRTKTAPGELRTTALSQGSAYPGKKPLIKPRVQPTAPPSR